MLRAYCLLEVGEVSDEQGALLENQGFKRVCEKGSSDLKGSTALRLCESGPPERREGRP